MEPEKLLVKLYVMNSENVWEDKCTGFLFFYEFGKEDDNHFFKLVIAEDPQSDTFLFEFDLNPSINYIRRQDTLLSWDDGETEYALSFQNEDVCQITHETIEKSLKILNSAETSGNQILEIIDFPELNRANLPEISERFLESTNNAALREQLTNLVDQKQFISNLLEIFRTSEYLEDRHALGCLYNIVKTIFTFSKFSIFELLLNDNNLIDVLGIMEYNPALSTPVPHREIVKSSRLVEIIPFSTSTIKELIIHTHRLQYLTDLILPTPAVFEERASYLASFAFFRRNEILEILFDDPTFLSLVFSSMKNLQIDPENQKNLLRLVVEICAFSKNLQAEHKETFMEKLLSYDLIGCLEKLISACDSPSQILDILIRVSETHPDCIRRELIITNDMLLMNFIIKNLIDLSYTNEGLQAIQLMKAILDISNSQNNDQSPKSSTHIFLLSFYSNFIDKLTIPIFNYTQNNQLNESYNLALAIENILDLICICVTYHSFHIKNYLFRSDCLKKISLLTDSKYAFVAHSAVKVIRRALVSPEEFYSRYILKEKIIDPIINVLIGRHKKYDIVNSAILELFEFLLLSGNKTLSIDLVDRHYSIFNNITYVSTFFKFINTVEQWKIEHKSKIHTSFLINSDTLFKEQEHNWIESDSGLLNDDHLNISPLNEENGVIFDTIKPKFQLDEDFVQLRPHIINSNVKIKFKKISCLNNFNDDETAYANLKAIENGPLVDYSDDDENNDILPPCDDYKIEENIDQPSPKKQKIVDISS